MLKNYIFTKSIMKINISKKMNIYKSKFLNIDFEEEKKLFYFTWLDTTLNMKKKDYEQEMLNYLEEVKKYKPFILLVDDRQMQFVISVELQEWIGENILSKVSDFGLSAFAVVMNADTITKIATELAVDENPDPDALKSAFFENIEEAKQWLLHQI